MASKELKELRRLSRFGLGGALAVEGSSLIGKAGSASDLSGSIPGFVGIGVAGAASEFAFDMAEGKRRRKRKRKR